MPEAVPIPRPEPPPRLPWWRTWYHPLSGAAILGIDLLAFGGEAATGFLDTLFLSAAAFLVTLAAVYAIQRRLHADRPGLAWGKAILGAVLAGLPFSIAGGLFGAAVLTLSGLPHPAAWKAELLARSLRRR